MTNRANHSPQIGVRLPPLAKQRLANSDLGISPVVQALVALPWDRPGHEMITLSIPADCLRDRSKLEAWLEAATGEIVGRLFPDHAD